MALITELLDIRVHERDTFNNNESAAETMRQLPDDKSHMILPYSTLEKAASGVQQGSAR